MSKVAQDLLTEFGEAVHRARGLKGWQLKDLSIKMDGNSSISFLSDIEKGKRSIGIPTVGKLIQALDLKESWIDRFIEAKKSGKSDAPGIPSDQTLEARFKELVEELNRQSNLSSEVHRLRAEAKAALAKEDYTAARSRLDDAAKITQNTAEHANLDYARSLAALGNLAFTERDYAEARLQFSKAITLSGLEDGRLASYRNSYRIASNAVMSFSRTYDEGRRVLDEMVAAGVKPNEVS